MQKPYTGNGFALLYLCMIEFKLKPILVLPFVKAYYTKHGFTQHELILLSSLLQNPSHRYDSKIKSDNFFTLVEWHPPIPESLLWDVGNNELSPTNAKIFANYLDRQIKLKLELAIKLEILFCEMNNTAFVIKHCLERVRNDLLMLDEDEMLLESIIKYIQRYCKRNNIQYAHVKKTSGNVLKTSVNSVKKTPEGYLKIEDWLKKARICRKTFFSCFRNEFPSLIENGVLYIKTVD